MRTLLLRTILTTILLGFSACHEDKAAGGNDLLGNLNKGIESIKDQFNSAEIDSKAQQELEKLFVFEYKVHEFPSNVSSKDFEEELNKLGKDRWECFYIEPAPLASQAASRAFCKRRPKTYLRYIPRVF